MFACDELMELFSKPMQFPWLYEFRERIEQWFNVKVAYIEYKFAERIQQHIFYLYMYSNMDWEKVAVVNGRIIKDNEPIMNEILSDILDKENITEINSVKTDNIACHIRLITFEETIIEEYGIIASGFAWDIQKEVNADLAVFHFQHCKAVCIFNSQSEIADFILSGKFDHLNKVVISFLKEVDKYGFIHDDGEYVICDTLENYRANPMYMRDI